MVASSSRDYTHKVMPLTWSWAVAVGGVYWNNSVLNDGNGRIVGKCGLNLRSGGNR